MWDWKTKAVGGNLFLETVKANFVLWTVKIEEVEMSIGS